jgi:hypothetical protein
LFAACWIVEFITDGGRIGFDANDFGFAPILATGRGWPCELCSLDAPECGNTSFVDVACQFGFIFRLNIRIAPVA